MNMSRAFAAVLAVAASSVTFAVNLGTANDFNAFIFGNATTNGGHSDGSIAIAGNWVMGGHIVSSSGSAPAPNLPVSATNVGMYVGGNVTANNQPKVNSGRNAYIGGSLAGSIQMNGNGDINPAGSSIDTTVFTDYYTYATDLSAALYALGGTHVASTGVNLNLTTNTTYGDLKVYTIDASSLDDLSTIDFTGYTGNETIVFNVLGANVNWKTSYNGPATRTIWNMGGVANLNVSERDLTGSVLAPSANVIQNRNIQGTLVASQWVLNNSVELHSRTFDGNLDAVPEPSMLAFGALAGLAALRRRRKSAA